MEHIWNGACKWQPSIHFVHETNSWHLTKKMVGILSCPFWGKQGLFYRVYLLLAHPKTNERPLKKAPISKGKLSSSNHYFLGGTAVFFGGGVVLRECIYNRILFLGGGDSPNLP